MPVLERVRGIAADRRTSVSRVIAHLVEAALEGPPPAGGRLHRDAVTGLVTIRLPTVITSSDVRDAEDEA